MLARPWPSAAARPAGAPWSWALWSWTEVFPPPGRRLAGPIQPRRTEQDPLEQDTLQAGPHRVGLRSGPGTGCRARTGVGSCWTSAGPRREPARVLFGAALLVG